MDIYGVYKVIQDSLTKVGIEPEDAKTEGEGQWLLMRNKTEIYVDAWVQEENSQWQYFQSDQPVPVFQVVSPVCFLPEGEARAAFMEELLYINFHMYYGSFTINEQENMAAIRYRVPGDDMDEKRVIEVLDSIGYYSETLMGYLTDKYNVDPVLDEDQ